MFGLDQLVNRVHKLIRFLFVLSFDNNQSKLMMKFHQNRNLRQMMIHLMENDYRLQLVNYHKSKSKRKLNISQKNLLLVLVCFCLLNQFHRNDYVHL